MMMNPLGSTVVMSTGETSTRFPASASEWKYDVFLSFRGEDTRKGFTDHLHNALESKGIITFMGDPKLHKGESISPGLLTAIEQSRFALIVLSENYASSTWCLIELLHILKCLEARAAVLPIFYNVDPSDVRKQTGRFAEAFIKYGNNPGVDEREVESWRYALTKVAGFSGWDSKDWSEAKLVRDIVQVVWKKWLDATVWTNFVAIESRSKPIIDLCLDATVNDGFFIGIWGMGGIGKTTIARVVYERISHVVPGSQIPECFNHRSVGFSISVDFWKADSVPSWLMYDTRHG